MNIKEKKLSTHFGLIIITIWGFILLSIILINLKKYTYYNDFDDCNTKYNENC